MRYIAIFLIKIYQSLPLSSHSNCKFTPTCSEYTKQAIIKYGVLRGSLKGIKRILRCNPFSKGGYDPVR